MCYLDGIGVEKDQAKGVKLIKNAADDLVSAVTANTEGLAHAKITLGYCYLTGNGADKNLVEARKWFTLAAKQGDVSAKGLLTVCN